jgi:pyruvate dehydrogenase (quinone)
MEFYPKPGQARCVQIERDPTRVGLRHPVDVALVGDCREVLQSLLPLVQKKADRGFLEQAQGGMKEWNELLRKRAAWTDKPLKPQVVAEQLNQFLDRDAIVTTDCGTVTSWAARYVRMRGDMMFSASGMLATMGNGLPYSIAAAIAYPGRQVVCLSGDGGFTMLMAEMLTLVKYKLPVKVIVFKNNTLGQIKWEQMVFEGNPEFGVDLQPLDFAMYARACGAGGFSVEDPEDVQPTLAKAFAHPGPAVVEALVDANEPAMPGHVTMEQAWKFAEALVRGEKNRAPILENVLKQQIREVV